MPELHLLQRMKVASSVKAGIELTPVEAQALLQTMTDLQQTLMEQDNRQYAATLAQLRAVRLQTERRLGRWLVALSAVAGFQSVLILSLLFT